MAPLFPPIATHLADNPKIFLFIVRSDSSERHALNFVEAIWENCIVGYIACDDLGDVQWVADIVRDELAHPSMSVQEIFTSIREQVPHTATATMTVVDRLKEPVYLYPRSRSQGIYSHMSIMYSHTSHHASLRQTGTPFYVRARDLHFN